MIEWFYEKGGKKLGPLPEDRLLKIREAGEVTDNTLVWNTTFGGEWRRFSEAGVGTNGNSPPPLPAERLDDSFAWIFAVVPIIGLLIESFLTEIGDGSAPEPGAVVLGYAVAYGILAYLDGKQILRSGRNPNSSTIGWLFWLAPMYLFKRARIVGQGQHLLIIWIVAFMVSIVSINQRLL
jgi:hypothetical protein